MMKYLILGDGKVATHFEHYFTLQKVPFISWSRKKNSNAELPEAFERTDVCLLLISDMAIEPFLTEHHFLRTKPCVHFSGSLVTPMAWGAHPLNTFPHGHYNWDVYQKTYFVCEKSDFQFSQIFPDLPNPVAYIDKEKKALYHALCSVTGNFTSLLWQRGFQDFESKLGIGREPLIPFLETIAANLIQHPEHAATGPLVRKDLVTLRKHLDALEGDPLQKIYQSFIQSAGLEVPK